VTLRSFLVRPIIAQGKAAPSGLQHSKGVGREIARNSFVVKILTYKVFVMKILRGISPLEVGKSLIPDILEKRGGGGEGLTNWYTPQLMVWFSALSPKNTTLWPIWPHPKRLQTDVKRQPKSYFGTG